MILVMFMMVLLTMIVGICALAARLQSVRSGEVKARSYKLMDGEYPDKVVQTTRCFNNQFEIPVLFYAGALAYLVTGQGDNLLGLVFAVLFVVSRYCHAWIHLSANHLLQRLTVFWVGVILMFLFWINLLVLNYISPH